MTENPQHPDRLSAAAAALATTLGALLAARATRTAAARCSEVAGLLGVALALHMVWPPLAVLWGSLLLIAAGQTRR